MEALQSSVENQKYNEIHFTSVSNDSSIKINNTPSVKKTVLLSRMKIQSIELKMLLCRPSGKLLV